MLIEVGEDIGIDAYVFHRANQAFVSEELGLSEATVGMALKISPIGRGDAADSSFDVICLALALILPRSANLLVLLKHVVTLVALPLVSRELTCGTGLATDDSCTAAECLLQNLAFGARARGTTLKHPPIAACDG